MLLTNLLKTINFFFGQKIYNKINKTLVNTNDTLNFIANKDNLNVINVGVYNQTKYLIHHFPNSFHYLFEPNKFLNDNIHKNYKLLNYKLFNIGLSNKNCYKNLYLNEAGSTLHKYSGFTDAKSLKTKIKIKIKKLDDFKELSNNKFFFIKIDTEGEELAVLKGARKKLKNTKYILTETRLVPCYENSYSFEDIFEEMALNNFKFGLVSEVGSPYKKLYRYLDILWVKKDAYDEFLQKILDYQNK